jgi:carotenoid cleavage dioxygenase-like enzyme
MMCHPNAAQIEGTLPAELQGTLLRNGPGLFEVGTKRIPQPFDGDGMVSVCKCRPRVLSAPSCLALGNNSSWG